MAFLRDGCLLGLLSLVIVTLITKADGQAVPPRSCINTGLTCIESCSGQPDGDYQWCGGCQHFIQCSEGIAFYQECPANLYWHDDAKACVPVSDTCTECIIDTTPNGATENTVTMTTLIPRLCDSTGPDCIDHCDVTHNGVYQWCGRCDYFLLCSGSEGFFMACQPGTYYDHTVEACVFESTTCQQSPCYDPLLSTTRFDACASQPCLNDGTCISTGNDFTCTCPDIFTGTRCQTFTNPCDYFPCLNGGTCVNLGGGSFTCTCPIEVTGALCELPANPCDNFPCVNGGTCNNLGDGSYTCTCPAGLTGPNCESPVGGPCDSNPCVNSGTCNNVGDGTFACFCHIDWTGVLCESPNYNESMTCGSTLDWAGYDASNGFTRFCYYWTPPEDIAGRAIECRYTITDIPLYDDYTRLLAAGGNFGCLVSQNFPDDLPATSLISCADDYQHDVSLGNFSVSDRLMVCVRYPYEGIPAASRKGP